MSVDNFALPDIPTQRYFSVEQVCALCHLQPHQLRYLEQEFTALRPQSAPRPRRHYQRHELKLIRRICHLLYHEGYSVPAVRTRLGQTGLVEAQAESAVRLSAAELTVLRDELLTAKHVLDAVLPSA